MQESQTWEDTMIEEKSGRQLSEIARLHSRFESSRIDHWLIGGWALDFHAGRVTRDHDDIDLAVWLRDMPRISETLERDGWKHSPKDDEDGGTGCEKDRVRLELTYLVQADDGSIYTRLRTGPVARSQDALGDDVLQLSSARCRVVSLASLKHSKSIPPPDHDDAAKDQADLQVLLSV